MRGRGLLWCVLKPLELLGRESTVFLEQGLYIQVSGTHVARKYLLFILLPLLPASARGSLGMARRPPLWPQAWRFEEQSRDSVSTFKITHHLVEQLFTFPILKL